MAIFDLIEWPDMNAGDMIHRLPPGGSGEFRLGSQLVVRESQAAIFYRDGKALDVFGPGRHTLSTLNLPIVSKLIGAAFGGSSPFRAEVYFVSTRVFPDMKWGTRAPIPVRDTELGLVRVRAFGQYSLRVADPSVFVGVLVAQQGRMTTAEIDEFLKNVVVSRLNDIMGENLKSIFDLAAVYDEIGVAAKMRTKADFEKYGLEVLDFYISAITPPDEVQQKIDERSAMGALGDLNKYTQYKAAVAMEKAAESGGGMGEGLGLGLGMGMGAKMAQSMAAAVAPTAPISGAPATPGVPCFSCAQSVPAGSKFCPSCGAKVAQAAFCTGCGASLPPGAKFCPGCGQKAG